MIYNPKLNPRAAFFLASHHLNPFSSVEKMPISLARNAYEFFALTQGGIPPELLNIENRVLNFESIEHGIPIRIYTSSDLPSPLLIYVHGGGWSLGSLNTHDTLCRNLSKTAGCTIVSVDYRLAPEHPHPAALEDVQLVYNWCQKKTQELNIIPNKIAIGGDSSGGNIAAAFTATCVEQNMPPPNFQLLLYPTLDLSLTQQSMIDLGTGHFLTKNEMEYYRTNYASNIDVNDWKVSPIHYTEFHQLPPAIILTAECDPLRDDGKLYAEKLKAAGVFTEYNQIPGMIHSFLQMISLFPKETSQSYQWLSEKMNAMWSSS
jgi:acetyl esterase